MSEKITRGHLEARIKRLNLAIGQKIEPWRVVGVRTVANVGVFHLDHASDYGGYQILRMNSESGGEAQPFGGQRMKAAECCHVLDAAIAGIELGREYEHDIWKTEAKRQDINEEEAQLVRDIEAHR